MGRNIFKFKRNMIYRVLLYGTYNIEVPLYICSLTIKQNIIIIKSLVMNVRSNLLYLLKTSSLIKLYF